jgi:zinc/manganese transport system substrate-binding protein
VIAAPDSLRSRSAARTRRAAALLVVAALAATALPAARASSARRAHSGSGVVIRVVAAENFWGSIASQLGGTHVKVISVIVNPNTDPHTYEPTTVDARNLAFAQLVIENGIGYDPWAPKLLSADQTHPVVLDVGALLGVAQGGNPHRWYNPTDVTLVVNRITKDLQRLDAANGAYFARQRARFETVLMASYDRTIAAIKSKYAGTPVGASESIFAMLAPALGLKLITPAHFLKAVSEGTDPSAADKATIDRQIAQHKIKIYVYNSQNVTPDVQAQLTEVRREHMPVATITETMVPATSTYQAWQTKQLMGIESALSKAVKAT